VVGSPGCLWVVLGVRMGGAMPRGRRDGAERGIGGGWRFGGAVAL